MQFGPALRLEVGQKPPVTKHKPGAVPKQTEADVKFDPKAPELLYRMYKYEACNPPRPGHPAAVANVAGSHHCKHKNEKPVREA